MSPMTFPTRPTAALTIGAVLLGLALAALKSLTKPGSIFQDLGNLATIDVVTQGPTVGVRFDRGDRLLGCLVCVGSTT